MIKEDPNKFLKSKNYSQELDKEAKKALRMLQTVLYLQVHQIVLVYGKLIYKNQIKLFVNLILTEHLKMVLLENQVMEFQ